MKKTQYRQYQVIDAHAHIFERIAGFGAKGELRPVGSGRGRYPTGDEVKILPDGYGDDFTGDALIRMLDDFGIAKAVLMQGSYLGFCNDYVFEATQQHPGRLFGMGTFDPYCKEYLRIMRRLAEDFGFLGFKFEMSTAYGFMGYHPDFKLDGSRMTPVFEYAADKKLVISIDMSTFGDDSLQLKELANVAQRYPEIAFVIEHIFYPQRDRYGEVRSALEGLAGFKNISFTTASIPNSTMPEAYPFPLALRYLEIAKDIVGAERLIWGSDLPGVLVNAPYDELIDYVAESGLFSSEELAAVYGGNAARIYGIELFDNGI